MGERNRPTSGFRNVRLSKLTRKTYLLLFTWRTWRRPRRSPDTSNSPKNTGLRGLGRLEPSRARGLAMAEKVCAIAYCEPQPDDGSERIDPQQVCIAQTPVCRERRIDIIEFRQIYTAVEKGTEGSI